ncbi:undecaprenyl-diphosphate phosphatase [Candidatus Dependentiae bacterium]|nr:undecaprenyl-diphosphate phosphatase [Candidatus Dependentiae bacterium]
MIIKAIILGIIQGLTEFLPISSTAHLIIIEKYLFLSENIPFVNMFKVVIQSGSIIAVIIYFRKKIIPQPNLIKHFSFRDRYIQLWLKICLAFFPAAVAGLLFSDKIDELFEKPVPIAYALIFGALLLLFAEKKSEKNTVIYDEHNISFIKAFIVGIFQCLALWPGMSRSGSTIIGGFFLGFSRKAAAEFSFFLSIPTIIGASSYKLFKTLNDGLILSQSEWITLAAGTLVSFIVAYAVIALFMNFIRKNNLYVFAYYRIILGILVLIF